jgi:hypothetical protein
VNKIVRGASLGTELEGRGRVTVAGVDMKNLEKAREVGKGLLPT